MKDFAWSCGVQNIKVMDPGRALMDRSALDEGEDRDLWTADPVPLSATAYDIIARQIRPKGPTISGKAYM